jgi:hypothetical protein
MGVVGFDRVGWGRAWRGKAAAGRGWARHGKVNTEGKEVSASRWTGLQLRMVAAQALFLRRVRHFSYTDIGRILDIPRQTARDLVEKGKAFEEEAEKMKKKV